MGSPRPVVGQPKRGLHDPCGCANRCGDDGDVDGPGICKGFPLPPRPPLVEVVLVHRDHWTTRLARQAGMD